MTERSFFYYYSAAHGGLGLLPGFRLTSNCLMVSFLLTCCREAENKPKKKNNKKEMVMVQLLQQKRSSSYSWWFDSHKSPRQSPWLLSTLSELEEKTTTMLKLIEEDADSFAQRAEMYYKKRPELVNMVQDFYRAHRSLAEQFDQLKSENRTRHTTPLGSPTKACWLQNLSSNAFDRYAVTPEPSESEESEVDDPEDGGESDSNGREEVLKNMEDDGIIVDSSDKEILQSRDKQKQQQDEVIITLKQMAEELEKLKEENRVLKAQLQDKDEQKREVIRQLTLSMSILKEENVELKKRCVGASRKGSFDIKKLVLGAWSGRLFSGLQTETRTTLVAL